MRAVWSRLLAGSCGQPSHRSARCCRKPGYSAVIAAHCWRPTAADGSHLDLAIMAEGGIVVPLYARQAPAELASMMKDCAPKLLVCADEELKQSILSVWPNAPKTLLYSEIFSSNAGKQLSVGSPVPLSADSPVAIIYTSGTSGDAKGVVLNVGNLSFMVQRTTSPA